MVLRVTWPQLRGLLRVDYWLTVSKLGPEHAKLPESHTARSVGKSSVEACKCVYTRGLGVEIREQSVEEGGRCASAVRAESAIPTFQSSALAACQGS